MFILTDDNKLINADHLSMIRRNYTAVEAYSYETGGYITLAVYGSKKECELAFDALIENMKEKKELYVLNK